MCAAGFGSSLSLGTRRCIRAERSDRVTLMKQIIRNSTFNVAGQVIPLVAALVLIPHLLRVLGNEKFGLLSLIWSALSSSNLFNVGLAKATTRYASKLAAQHDDNHLRQIAWTSLTAQLLLGLIGASLLASVAGRLVGWLQVPGPLQEEAGEAFRVLALAIPAILVGSSLRGLLEAGQRFDLANAVRAPLGVLDMVLPAVALARGWPLPAAVGLLVASRYLSVFLLALFCRREFPVMGFRPAFTLGMLRLLVGFGGWVALSDIVFPLLSYLDRFLVASLAGLEALAYYSVTYEGVTRLLIIPTGLATALFPILSSYSAADARNHRESRVVYVEAAKLILIVIVPLMALMSMFGREILALWVNESFADRASPLLPVLGVGVILNSLAMVPSTALQAIGRPDVRAKLHVIEVPLYLLVGWVLVPRLGALGAALTWTFRVLIVSLILFPTAARVGGFQLRNLEVGELGHSLALCLFYVGLSVFVGLQRELTVRAVLASLVTAAFLLLVWLFALSPRERRAISSLVPGLFKTIWPDSGRGHV